MRIRQGWSVWVGGNSVLSFGQVGALALPLIYSGLLDVTGS